MSRPFSGRIRAGMLLVATYWLGLFIATHLPNSKKPLGFNVWDKAEHFSAYAILALLLCIGFRTGRRAWRRRCLCIFATVVAYGALDELLQAFVPGRHPDVLDWVADTLGAMCGIAIYFVATRCLMRRKSAQVVKERSAKTEPVGVEPTGYTVSS